jgi:hypothetical protein
MDRTSQSFTTSKDAAEEIEKLKVSLSQVSELSSHHDRISEKIRELQDLHTQLVASEARTEERTRVETESPPYGHGLAGLSAASGGLGPTFGSPSLPRPPGGGAAPFAAHSAPAPPGGGGGAASGAFGGGSRFAAPIAPPPPGGMASGAFGAPVAAPIAPPPPGRSVFFGGLSFGGLAGAFGGGSGSTSTSGGGSGLTVRLPAEANANARRAAGSAAAPNRSETRAQRERRAKLTLEELIRNYTKQKGASKSRPLELETFIAEVFKTVDIPLEKPANKSLTVVLKHEGAQIKERMYELLSLCQTHIESALEEEERLPIKDPGSLPAKIATLHLISIDGLCKEFLAVKEQIDKYNASQRAIIASKTKELSILQLERLRLATAIAVFKESNNHNELNGVIADLEARLYNVNFEIKSLELLRAELSFDRTLHGDFIAIAYERLGRKIISPLRTLTGMIKENPRLNRKQFTGKFMEVSAEALTEFLLTCGVVKEGDIALVMTYIQEAATVVTAASCVNILKRGVSEAHVPLAQSLIDYADHLINGTIRFPNIQPPRVGLEPMTFSHILSIPFELTRQFFSVLYGTDHEPNTPLSPDDRDLATEFAMILEAFVSPELEDMTDPATPGTPANDRRTGIFSMFRNAVKSSKSPRKKDIEEGLNVLEAGMVAQEERAKRAEKLPRPADEEELRQAALKEIIRLRIEREQITRAKEEKAREAATRVEHAREAATREAKPNETELNRDFRVSRGSVDAKYDNKQRGGAYSKRHRSTHKQKYKKRTKTQNKKTRKQKGNTRRI